MTSKLPDSEPMFDGLTLLVAELADSRDRDARTHSQFMALLGCFAEAVARDTLERQDEMRARLEMPPSEPAAPVRPLRIADVEWLKCPYCGETLRSPKLDLHLPYCTRAGELGFARRAPPAATGKADLTERIDALPEPLRSKVRDGSFTVDEVADHVKDKLRGGTRGGGMTDLTTSSSTGAAEANSNAEQLTGKAATETSTAPSNARMPDDVRDAIKADYEAGRGSMGRAPNGLLDRLALKHKRCVSTIKKVIYDCGKQPAAPAAKRPCSSLERVGSATGAAASARAHTNGHNCWCRKGANGVANRWCSIAPAPPVLPGMRSRVQPTVRNERFAGERARRDPFEGEA